MVTVVVLVVVAAAAVVVVAAVVVAAVVGAAAAAVVVSLPFMRCVGRARNHRVACPVAGVLDPRDALLEHRPDLSGRRARMAAHVLLRDMNVNVADSRRIEVFANGHRLPLRQGAQTAVDTPL